jgi:hypothetical protein
MHDKSNINFLLFILTKKIKFLPLAWPEAPFVLTSSVKCWVGGGALGSGRGFLQGLLSKGLENPYGTM